ncbi:ketoacyl-synt-domain-containing protein [Durotheca rogersii]|uniref:ketoacyl-synt-domain-containing protein n=1 Tax=Durotheca rogersii TaxID=419775 RepID=UPI00222084DB|nr:ketoacyl-synt-domain-containing protein [Durotheca rogersii]KAI5864121.1 ketoacyl-synt-domain-containing protein [Durotheca rogersii]
MAPYPVPENEPIAVVGSGCRFAGDATSPSKLWKVLREAPDLSREVPPERFNAAAFYHKDGEYHGTTNSIKAYWLDQDHRVFDARMFHITPKEAEAIDPQQRLLLEVVYEAMESAGYKLSDVSGSDTAVFAGVMTADYDTLSQRDELSTSQYYATGNARSIISNRVSYFFNFQGPSMTIDTACSSSLVALHQAVTSLRAGESSLACVTGVNLMITPEQFIVESSLHMLSPSGRSQMWDASADGYARGEGIAALFIKPLSKALQDGDRIECILRETGVNSDGRTQGITMPNPSAQSMLIVDTYRKSGLVSTLPEHHCQYFEAHGTGTPAGDPREAQAIHKSFFGNDESLYKNADGSQKRILVGSIKTVLGHTEGAAGLAGLLKVIQSMKHNLIPPNLHLKKLNPAVEPFCSNLEVPTTLVPWPKPPAGQPKRASVNSFGFGGANAHVIVESYEPEIHGYSGALHALPLPSKLAGQASCAVPLLISAGSPKSLRDMVQAYRDFLQENPGVTVGQLSWALYKFRTAHPYRFAIPTTSRIEAINSFNKVLATPDGKDLKSQSKTVKEGLKILGIFTGQGAQWATMSRALFLTNDVYRNLIRNLDVVLKSLPDPPSWSLQQQILADAADSKVNIASVSQPLSTAVQVALVDLIRSLGIGFHTVVGHSSGEIAAAYAAGKINAREAITIAYHRGYWTGLAANSGGRKGGMLAAGLTEAEALQFCSRQEFIDKVHLAASNAPSSVTLSGDLEAINAAHDQLTKEGKFSRMLRVDAAYHSPYMAEPAVKYVEVLNQSDIEPDFAGNGTVWVSSVYGRTISEAEDLKAEYWRDNMLRMVRFSDAVSAALSEHGPFDGALEIGPHATFKGPFSQICKSLGHDVPYMGTLSRGKDDTEAFSDFIGQFWSQFGPHTFDLAPYFEHSPDPSVLNTRLANLPTYSWDHSQIHYRESRVSRQYHFKDSTPHELLGVRTRDDNDKEWRWRNLLRGERLPWASGHAFQGQALLPASAYCIMALDAARAFLKGRPASMVELRDMQIFTGISIDNDSTGIEVLFSLVVDPPKTGRRAGSVLEATFSLTSCPANGTTDMRLNMTGAMKIYLGEPSSDILPSRLPSAEDSGFQVNPESFYDMMDQTSLVYGGPFKGIKTIRRRYNYCTAAVDRVHAEDTTSLDISPATLDSCFQSAFLTYSSPGDKSLWTSFLPTSIDLVRFNLATHDRRDDTLTVDTHLTRIDESTYDSKARFTVEIGIFNDNNEMEIQVDGLCVQAIAHIQPKDDLELYLHTVMDLDPTDEIVADDTARDAAPDPTLVEACARVAICLAKTNPKAELSRPDLESLCDKLASTFPDVLRTVGPDSWPLDTEETIEKFIEDSEYHEWLALLRDMADGQGELADIIPRLVQGTDCLTRFNKHVSRIVKQIVHRFPRMNILSLAEPEGDLVSNVLSAVGPSFFRFVIGTETARDPTKGAKIAESAAKKIVSSPLDLTKDLAGQLKSDSPYDLVLVSVSQLEANEELNILKNIRSIMRSGGYLVLVNLSKISLRSQLLETGQDTAMGSMTPPEWPDLLDAYEFIELARNSNQSYYPGYTVMVRQLGNPVLQLVKQPSVIASGTITDHLLILGGTAWNSKVVDELHGRLAHLCGQISVQDSLETISAEVLGSCTAAIILQDLDGSIMANLTAQDLDNLRELLRPEMKVLWLTLNSRTTSPFHAATFGFTRTVQAEVPRFTLQVLDLDTIEDARVISDAFIRLLGTAEVDAENLWSDEKEIHVENGRMLVPRVLPLKQGIDRLNALRRFVGEQVNTLKETVKVVQQQSPTGMSYVAINDHESVPEALQHKVRVDYSSVDSLKFGGDASAYLCVGHDITTDEPVIGLSKSNGSFVWISTRHLSSLPLGSRSRIPLIHHAQRYVIAATIKLMARNKRVVMIGSDPDLDRCLSEVGLSFISYSTNPNTAQRYLHPRASDQQVKDIFPLAGALVFNILGDAHADLSEHIDDMVPANCSYYSRAVLFGGATDTTAFFSPDLPEVDEVWNDVVLRAANQSESSNVSPRDSSVVSLPQLQASTNPVWSPFQIIDWRADRSVTAMVKHIANENLFRPDRTYVMIGMTRDFGQSLCYLFVKYGARNIVMASRSGSGSTDWAVDLARTHEAKVQIRKVDVTSLDSVLAFKEGLSKDMPEVAGVINGAMVLDDRVFAQMDIETWRRVMLPKTVGSLNLHTAFHDTDLDFFIMTSSFAAIGGHPGQSNYAAANMYMNGLAALRRGEGRNGSVLNIGVIYGLGFLQREKEELYAGLEREGYPPISERDLHHMFLEAILAGRSDHALPPKPYDITTGLSRYDPTSANLLHWQRDARFSHYTLQKTGEHGPAKNGSVDVLKKLADDIAAMTEVDEIAAAIEEQLLARLELTMQLPKGSISPIQNMTDLGIDSLTAVEIRGWFYRAVGKDISVIKLLSGISIHKLCEEVARQIVTDRAQ